MNESDLHHQRSTLTTKAALLACALLLNSSSAVHAEVVYNFTNYAGVPGGMGNTDGIGPRAAFKGIFGLAADRNGNIFVAEYNNCVVRKVTPAREVTTVAGICGFSAIIDGPPDRACFAGPQALAVAADGAVFVADSGAIRRIEPNGQVTTLPAVDSSGTNVSFMFPAALAVDPDGNLFIAEQFGHVVRKLSPQGLVTVVAGRLDEAGARDGLGTDARLNGPTGLAFDASNNLYIADQGNKRLRRMDSSGYVSTVKELLEGGWSQDAQFGLLKDVAVDAQGVLYVTSPDSCTVKKLTPQGRLSVLAGREGYCGFQDGIGTSALLSQPRALAIDPSGCLYVGETHLRKVTPGGSVSSFAGIPSGAGSADGPIAEARFNYPVSLAFDSSGNLFVSEEANRTIRKITASATVMTLAGASGQPGDADGVGTQARFEQPRQIAVDSTGNAYVADKSNHRIRKITPNGIVSTFAGNQRGTNDGPRLSASFNSPSGICVDAFDNIYIADTENCTLRKITTSGTVMTLAGSPGQCGYTDGVGSHAKFNYLEGLAIDADGNLYVADTGNSTIRKVTSDGIVTTLAGNPYMRGSIDGIGFGANFVNPRGIACGPSGDVFVVDTAASLIRRITPDGKVTTIGGLSPFRGSWDGIGRLARFVWPSGIAVDKAGNLFVADEWNNRISKGTPFEASPFAPTIQLSTNQVLASVGFVTEVLTAFLSDPDTDPANLHLTVLSSDPTIVSSNEVFFDKHGTDPTSQRFTIAPKAYGTASLTFVVNDGLLTNSTTLFVTTKSRGVFIENATPLTLGYLPAASSAQSYFNSVRIGRATVTLRGLKGVSPSQLRIGLYGPAGQVVLMDAGQPSGSLDYAQITFADGAPALLPYWDQFTGTAVAPAQALSRLNGTAPGGSWTLSVTNTDGGTGTILNGWRLNLQMAPWIFDLPDSAVFQAWEDASLAFHIVDVDGAITNVGAAFLGNPGFAQISTAFAGTNALVRLNASQVGTNVLSIWATDDEGFWTTNYVNVVIKPGVAPEQFFNTNSIVLNGDSRMTPYPAQIVVSGLQGRIWKLTATVHGLSCNYNQLGLLLVGPQGQNVVLLRENGATASWKTTLCFDDTSTNIIRNYSELSTGTFRCSDFLPDLSFLSPAPAGPYNGGLSAFNGTDPNGTWSLYVMSENNLGTAAISEGWSLAITTEPVLTFGPSFHDFGPVPVGLTSDRTFFITNSGRGLLTGSATVQPPFSILSGGQFSLAAGESQPLTVRFAPPKPGFQTNRIEWDGVQGSNPLVSGFGIAPPTPVKLQAGVVYARSNNTVTLPISVSNFSDVSVLQFSLHWDHALATCLGVEQLGVLGLSTNHFNFPSNYPGTVVVSWDEPNGFCQSLADGTTLFALKFLLTGGPEMTNHVFFDDTPLAMEAADCGLNLLPLEGSPGFICSPLTYWVGGKILSASGGKYLASSEVFCITNVNSFFLPCAEDGSFGDEFKSGGNLSVTPIVKWDSPANRGVTTLDVALIQRHVLGLAPLSSPYALLAADANGSGTITTTDIALARRLVLGLVSTLPSGVWRLVPAEYVFADPSSPWNAPTNVFIPNISGPITNLDFLAIKRGDVNGSWGATAPQKPRAALQAKNANAVVLIAEGRTAHVGEEIEVPIRAKGFQDVTTAQFSLGWNPALLRFRAVRMPGLTELTEANFGDTAAAQGTLSFSWNSSALEGDSLTDSTPLFTAVFSVIGAPGSIAQISFTAAPTEPEVSRHLLEAEVQTCDGSVLIEPQHVGVSCHFEPSANMVKLSVLTSAGTPYVVECAETLESASWKTVHRCIGDGNVYVWQDPAPSSGRKFYRVRAE